MFYLDPLRKFKALLRPLAGLRKKDMEGKDGKAERETENSIKPH